MDIREIRGKQIHTCKTRKSSPRRLASIQDTRQVLTTETPSPTAQSAISVPITGAIQPCSDAQLAAQVSDSCPPLVSKQLCKQDASPIAGPQITAWSYGQIGTDVRARDRTSLPESLPARFIHLRVFPAIEFSKSVPYSTLNATS